MIIRRLAALHKPVPGAGTAASTGSNLRHGHRPRDTPSPSHATPIRQIARKFDTTR